MAYCVHVDGKRIFVIGGEPLEPEDFDRQIIARFSTKYEPAWQEALETIKHFDPETLKSQRQFYEKVYKPNRDELAKKWSTMVKEQ